MYTYIDKCRACGGSNLRPVFSLGVQPLANDFKRPDEDHAGYAPLEVLFCEDCTLAQLSVVVAPGILYGGDYSYVTSASETMKRHFKTLLDDIISEAGPHKTILEVGSNDGSLLAYCLEREFSHVQAVEPAKNLAAISCTRGVPTRNSFFTSRVASEMGKADVVLARHCFAHVADWRDFVDALEHVTHRDSLVCIEVPYVMDLLERTEFDTIYHEHLSFVSIRAIKSLLEKTNFYIYGINRYPIHGGAILIMLRRKEAKPKTHPSISHYNKESITPETWEAFGQRAKQKAQKLREIIYSSSQALCGFGASAKCTVLLNYCNLDVDTVRFVTDNTPFKVGKQVPGTKIPVVEESHLPEARRAIMTAWNYKHEILEKEKEWRKMGGQFIIPGMEVEVV